jgi:hypothetical protein
MVGRLAISAGFWKDQSFDAAGACGGAIETGADAGAAARGGFGAGGFFAAASVAAGAPGGGDNGDGAAAVATGGFGVGGFATGSGVMILTGGVEAAVGKSALVGLPVGTPGISAATGAGADGGGAFHVDA